MPKKICSWDVGIINLAYCIIEKDDDDNFKILNWEVIDIAKKEKKAQCDTEDCARTAVYIYLDDDKLCNICGVHSKKHMKYMPSVEALDTEFVKLQEKNKCCHEECQTGAYYKYCNNTYCSVHKKTQITKELKKYKLKKIKGKNANKLPPHKMCTIMCNELDKRPHLLDVDEVIIENQPRLMNPVMGRVASSLSTYFVIRGCVDKKKDMVIHNISPSNKIKITDDKKVQIVKNEKDKKIKYKMTKKLAESYAKILIKDKDDNKWLNLFNDHPKQDDLADALLQGYYYLYHLS